MLVLLIIGVRFSGCLNSVLLTLLSVSTGLVRPWEMNNGHEEERIAVVWLVSIIQVKGRRV